MYLLIFLFLVTAFIYFLYNRNHYRKWEKLSVPGPKPIPIFGNMKKVALLQASLSELYEEIYSKFANCKYVGIFVMDNPCILLREPEIVENVLVKNFTSFHDNILDVKKENDPIFGNNPFTAKGEYWKNKRTQHLSGLTPSKVKTMYPELNECGNLMVSYLNTQIENSGKSFSMEALELAARYLTETCTAVGLGITAHSFTDKPDLREAGKAIFEPNMWRSAKLFIVFLLPKLANFMTFRLIPESLYRKYKHLVQETLRYRTENNIQRNDFFQHLQEFRGEKLTVEEMTAQLGGLYIDGFGTNSSGLSFMIYAIASHPEVQDKIRNEIQVCLERYNGVLSFDGIQEMLYLDAVMSESLRRYPPFPNLTKICTRECTLPKATEGASDLTVEVGTPAIIPIYSIQNNEKYFPNPEKFDPERFLGSNKESVVKYSYVPFGEGPRICLGMRYAQLQSKIALVKLVQTFKMSVNKRKTKSPIDLHPHSLVLAATDGLWINFEKL